MARKWQYKVLGYLDLVPNGQGTAEAKFERTVNDQDASGWEFVSPIRLEGSNDTFVFLFRQPTTGD